MFISQKDTFLKEKYTSSLEGPSDQMLDLFGPALDAGGKPEGPKKNLRKQVWTENQEHISAEAGDRSRDSLMQIEGRYAALTCFPSYTCTPRGR